MKNNDFYYKKTGIRNDSSDDEVSLSGLSEYNFVPNDIRKKFKNKIYNYGKITKNKYIFLFIKYYDLDSNRYYLMSIDKNYKILSSVSIYGYFTIDENTIYSPVEKKSGTSFVHFKKEKQYISVYTSEHIYIFSITDKGELQLQSLMITE